MQKIVHANEEQLVREIDDLSATLDDDEQPCSATSSKWARSYLRELLRDREDQLRLLRYRRVHTTARPN